MGSAVLVMVAFMTAFGGMLVVSVLYLTGTLGWSEQIAGLGLAAGPALVVVVSRLSGRLVTRIGAGPVALLAAIVFGLGPGWWLIRLGATPAYWTGFLPGLLLTGVGVGLMLPTLSALVGSALPAAQWGSGSSLIKTARQVGSVLGVALLVTAIGTAATGRPEELPLLRAGWVQLVLAAAASALFAVVLTVAERRARTRAVSTSTG